MTKALFFDIDGTLVSFNTHDIPDSTVDALERAKARGVRIFIATGRPVAFINNLGKIKHLIDGYMTTNGGYCFIGDDTVAEYVIDKADVAAVTAACRERHTGCVVVGKHKISALYPEKMEYIMTNLLRTDYHSWMSPLDEALSDDILQLTPFFDQAAEDEVVPSLRSCVAARWYPDFVDITARNADKGRGLQSMADFCGIDVADTMAFGDGGNDIPIIRKAGTGVVMGNGGDEVKAVADYVTSAVDDDGIKRALEHFGVI